MSRNGLALNLPYARHKPLDVALDTIFHDQK